MRVPALIAVAAFGALIASRTFRAALLRRGHQDLGGFVGYLVLTGVIVLVALSAFVVPGMWQSIWHKLMGAYNGND